MTADNKLSFEPHLNTLCKKVSHELHTLARVPIYIFQKKLNNESIHNIGAWLLPIGMCVLQQKINKINNLHERTLRLGYKDRRPTFKELLIQEKPVSVYH